MVSKDVMRADPLEEMLHVPAAHVGCTFSQEKGGGEVPMPDVNNNRGIFYC
jgi:hypothetical protein